MILPFSIFWIRPCVATCFWSVHRRIGHSQFLTLRAEHINLAFWWKFSIKFLKVLPEQTLIGTVKSKLNRTIGASGGIAEGFGVYVTVAPKPRKVAHSTYRQGVWRYLKGLDPAKISERAHFMLKVFKKCHICWTGQWVVFLVKSCVKWACVM
jgi:hypothetical protein